MRLSESDKNKILLLNSLGENSKQIAAQIGCCAKTVQFYLKSQSLNKTFVYQPKEKTKCANCDNLCITKFCSRSCSAIYNNYNKLTDEQKEKLQEKRKHDEKYKQYIGSEKLKKIAEDKLLNQEFDLLNYCSKRKRVKLEQDYKCDSCGLSEWLGLPIMLEVDHIDGNTDNNIRCNLRALCPNCHSMTDTWRGKNRSDLRNKRVVTLEEFKDAYLNTLNVRQTLISLNLAAKGGNYKRLYTALDAYNIKYIRQRKEKQ